MNRPVSVTMVAVLTSLWMNEAQHANGKTESQGQATAITDSHDTHRLPTTPDDADSTPGATETNSEKTSNPRANRPSSQDAEPSKPFPSTFFEGSPEHRKQLQAINAAQPPELVVDTWINSEPTSLEKLKGKVVVLYFWATWCHKCLELIPKHNALAAQYEDDIIIIGIAHDRGLENMTEVVKSKNIQFPTCHDTGKVMVNAYSVDSYPDYYILDRNGRLRIADCRNKHLEDAIKILIDEK